MLTNLRDSAEDKTRTLQLRVNELEGQLASKPVKEVDTKAEQRLRDQLSLLEKENRDLRT